MAIEEHDDEDEDVEEDEENEEEELEREEEEEEDDERRQPGLSLNAVKDKSILKSRTRTLLGHTHLRTEEDMTDRVEMEEEDEQEEEEQEEEEYEEEEEDEVVRPYQWEATAREREHHKVSFWHRRAHRQ